MVPLGDVRWPPHGAGDEENDTIQAKSITEAVAQRDVLLSARQHGPAVQQLSCVIVSHVLKIIRTR